MYKSIMIHETTFIDGRKYRITGDYNPKCTIDGGYASIRCITVWKYSETTGNWHILTGNCSCVKEAFDTIDKEFCPDIEPTEDHIAQTIIDLGNYADDMREEIRKLLSYPSARRMIEQELNK